jgi:isoquinoline 1-oxidoreductase alpha subunit
MPLSIKVNGETREVDASEDTPLLWVLRDHLKMTGTKFGCGIAQCGACTVHLDGQPVRSCVMPVGLVGDKPVTTIEGLSGPTADALAAAWRELDVPQCGYCQSGQLMTAEALLRERPKASSEEIDLAMTGNVCRCATYVRIRGAIASAAGKLGG